MKTVARYACLCQNSFQKATWGKYGLENNGEQLNLLFSILLFIMEKSLLETPCTMDDISAFTDEICSRYLNKHLSFEEARELADFIVNAVLSNDGQVMDFPAYSFEDEKFKELHVNYVETSVIYMEDSGLRRTSYKLTNDGYNLLLGTMEIEDNMKLSVQEMIFELQLKKKSYDKAEEAIKNVYMQVRVQIQKIDEDMNRIRRNPLAYTTEDYRQMLSGDLTTIEETRNKFETYKTMVVNEADKLEQAGINLRDLTKEEKEKLLHLKNIGNYLTHVLEDYQQILLRHYDLKRLYSEELERMTQMSMIKRFSLRNELYEKVLLDASLLDDLDIFISPLFSNVPEKIYNPNMALMLQKPSRKAEEKTGEIELDFDEEEYLLEKERERKERLKKYDHCLSELLKDILENNDEIRLSDLTPQKMAALVPDVEIFKEVMIEFLKNGVFDLVKMRSERLQTIESTELIFNIGELLLELTDEKEEFSGIQRIEAFKIDSAAPIIIKNVAEPDGRLKSIRCSDVLLRVSKE